MRIAFPIFADEHERYAEDVRLPEPGRVLAVRDPAGRAFRGTVVDARRVSDTELRVTVDTDLDLSLVWADGARLERRADRRGE